MKTTNHSRLSINKRTITRLVSNPEGKNRHKILTTTTSTISLV